jgi:hypothetical protein
LLSIIKFLPIGKSKGGEGSRGTGITSWYLHHIVLLYHVVLLLPRPNPWYGFLPQVVKFCGNHGSRE